MQLRALKGTEYSKLYELMKRESFPDTPGHFCDAKKYFETSLCYGKFSKTSQLEAGFVFGDLENECAFIDIVCQKNKRGKWATKATMKWLFKTIFCDLNLEYIWINPKEKESLKMALTLGFKYVHGLDESSPLTLILTKHNVSKKYLNERI